MLVHGVLMILVLVHGGDMTERIVIVWNAARDSDNTGG